MVSAKLQDDLLNEFREEKRLINTQIEIFDPLGISLRKPVAQRLASKGIIIFGELVCWLLMLGSVGLGVFLNRLYPFYILFQLKNPAFSEKLGNNNIQMLQWAVYGLIGVMALAFFFLARTLSRIRQKNDVLSLAGKHIKSLVGQHLERKAAIDAIEQRHFMEIPQMSPQHVLEVPNPGFDESSVERVL